MNVWDFGALLREMIGRIIHIEMQTNHVKGKKLDGTADHKFEIWETGSKN